MADENKVGEKIRQLRESREMSREELAEASQSDVELIEKIENGSALPSLTPLLNIARALGVRLGTFMSTFRNFQRMLEKTGDLNKVLSVLNPNFNPVKNPDLTLYDRITRGSDKGIPKMSMWIR